MVRRIYDIETFVALVFLAFLNGCCSRPDIYHVRPSGSRVIQPYSCHDPDTKEEGVCMFSWNCQRSNGTHLTYCMDRFYFGSCCKLPPGVYIATPPSIISNDVSVAQKYKPRPSTRRTTTQRPTTEEYKWTSEQFQDKRISSSTTKPTFKPTKVPQTEFPPGLVTWRPLEETISTQRPFKTKPTKLFSTKPLFASSTSSPKTTLRPKPTDSSPVRRTKPTSAQTESSTVSRRRTKPTRPYGDASTKRKTRPTRPYPSRSTAVSRVTQRRTKPTRPYRSTTSRPSTYRPTVSSTAISTESIGTWANILNMTARPVPIRTTRRPTPAATRVTSATPTRITSTTRRTTQSTTTRRPTRTTRRTTTTTTTRKPTTVYVRPSTIRSTTAPSEDKAEIITFPPFPGITSGTTIRVPVFSTTNRIRKTTTLKPTTTARATTSTTRESTTSSPTTVTTEKAVPNQDYTKVCGRPMPGPVGRVVGGGNSYFGEWPWVVSLRQWKKNTFLHKCGATLLNEFWAITAAHCVENVPLTDILLRLGEYDISHEREPLPFVERRVQIVASHPQFDRRTFEYDLALLRFYEPVTFQKNILPVCVPRGNNSYVGKYATVTGWGRLYEDGPLPDVIQEVALPVITNKVCENMYRQAGFVEDIPDIFICAGYADGGKDSCEGDSGGPMVIQEDDGRWVLAGVISWGIGCALPNQPGVYTRITKFAEWINQIIIF